MSTALKDIPIGSIITDNNTEWILIARNHFKADTATLMLKTTVESYKGFNGLDVESFIKFNIASSGSPWANSGLRLWLRGEINQLDPSEYPPPGFINLISEEMKNCIVPVTTYTGESPFYAAQITHEETIFVLSAAELGHFHHASGDGAHIPYFYDEARRACGYFYWTRTPDKTLGFACKTVGDTGEVMSIDANTALVGVRPVTNVSINILAEEQENGRFNAIWSEDTAAIRFMPMYPGRTNSPRTVLTQDISPGTTTIYVQDGSVLPDAPNLVVIGTDETAETILYRIKIGNTISDVERGFDYSIPRSWQQGTYVSRNHANYDQRAFIHNIQILGNIKDDVIDAGEF